MWDDFVLKSFEVAKGKKHANILKGAEQWR